MSVGNTNCYIDYAGDGSSAQFDFGFPAISANDIKCRITHADGSTEELQSTAYSVVLSGTGGSVTVAVPPASGETLRIYRTTPITQNTGFDTGYINNADISNAMDKLTLIAQELKRAADGTMFSVGTVAQGSPASADIEDGKLNLVLPKGEKGDKGDKGDTGNTGATGPSNTLSIGTVEGGATASATITGTSPNQTLNIVLPKGDKGDPGNAAVPIKIYMTDGTASHEVPLNSDGTECMLNAVYLNGIRQRAGIDYSVSVSEGIAQLTFATGLEDTDLVELEYWRIL